jgi:hypothetical protein
MVRNMITILIVLFFSTCKQASPDHVTIPVTHAAADTIRNPAAASPPDINKYTDSLDREMMLAGDHINKAYISKSDSSIFVVQNKYRDHRIFGYERPDIHSRKMILISIFTKDVEGNPFQCPLGAYYSSGSMENIDLKYVSTGAGFIKANVSNKEGILGVVFIEKKYTVFGE